MTGRRVFATLLLALLALPMARAQLDETVQTTPWTPGSTTARREHVIQLLTQLQERSKEVATQLGADSPSAEQPAEALLPEEVVALQEQLESDRTFTFSVLAADPAALVDLIAMDGVQARHVRGLLYEALGALGPDAERRALLDICDRLGRVAPFDAFDRLGQVATPDIERHVLGLLDGADRWLHRRCLRALELGGAEVTAKTLVPVMLRGSPKEASDVFNVLFAVAGRQGDVMARLLSDELERERTRTPDQPSLLAGEKRRVLAHQLLVQTASTEANSYLRAWVEDRLRTPLSPDGTAPTVLIQGIETALQALARSGEERAVSLVLQVEQENIGQDLALRLAAVRALALVPMADLGVDESQAERVLRYLVDALEVAEARFEPPTTRQVYVDVLRKLTGAGVSPSAAAWRGFVDRRVAEARARVDEAAND